MVQDVGSQKDGSEIEETDAFSLKISQFLTICKKTS